MLSLCICFSPRECAWLNLEWSLTRLQEEQYYDFPMKSLYSYHTGLCRPVLLSLSLEKFHLSHLHDISFNGHRLSRNSCLALDSIIDTTNFMILPILGDDDEEDDADFGSVGKKRRNTRIAKAKKASGNKCGHIIA